MTPPQDTLAFAVLRGEQSRRRLDDANELRAAATDLVAHAANCGFPRLVPASADAAILVGAAVAVANGDLTSRRARDPLWRGGGKALVVESVTVTGLHVRTAVEALRAAGADWVGAYVWRAHASRRDATWGDVDVLISKSA